MNIFSLFLLTFAFLSIFVLSKAQNEDDDDETRIIGGFPVRIETAKHQVSIRMRKNEAKAFGKGHVCGGSLITNQLVLTAAHCFFQNSKFVPGRQFLVVGGNSLRIKMDKFTNIHAVDQVIIHEGYVPNQYGHDIALLKLARLVRPDHPRFHPINMAKATSPQGTNCRISGWGMQSDKVGSKPSSKLMAVNVTIINLDECKQAYQEQLKQGMICAGVASGGKDACQGDSGGPLVCSEMLQGVVSFGKGCGLAEYPGVYTNVASYQPWIEQNIEVLNRSGFRSISSADQNQSIKIVYIVLFILFQTSFIHYHH